MSDFDVYNEFLNSRQDKGVFARFFDKWVKTGNMKENGLPEFIQRTYVEIKIRGSYDVATRAADDKDKVRFPREYQSYLLKKEKTKDGTPLTQFAFLTAPQIETCDLRGIYTVEGLAALSDEQAQSLNLKDEKDIAVKFIEASKNNMALAEYKKENEALKEQIAALKEEIKALKENK